MFFYYYFFFINCNNILILLFWANKWSVQCLYTCIETYRILNGSVYLFLKSMQYSITLAKIYLYFPYTTPTLNID